MDPNSLTTTPWFVDHKELLLVLAGGLCAMFGGFISTWYQARRARQIKLRETVGVEQVELFKTAMTLTCTLGRILVQGTLQEGIAFVTEKEQWFIDNVLFLPRKFVGNWISIRNTLPEAKEVQDPIRDGLCTDPKERTQKHKRVLQLRKYMQDLSTEAIRVLEKELGLPKVYVPHPPKETGEVGGDS